MLTALDKQILNLLQVNLPITSRPFAQLADELGVSEDTVLARLRALKAAGYIRRIGAFFDSAQIGYTSTLVALAVEPAKVAEVAETVNCYTGVTHNYEREGEYNLWFTLITPDLAAQQTILEHIAQLAGVKYLLNLPATRKYKVSVQFKLE